MLKLQDGITHTNTQTHTHTHTHTHARTHAHTHTHTAIIRRTATSPVWPPSQPPRTVQAASTPSTWTPLWGPAVYPVGGGGGKGSQWQVNGKSMVL